MQKHCHKQGKVELKYKYFQNYFEKSVQNTVICKIIFLDNNLFFGN